MTDKFKNDNIAEFKPIKIGLSGNLIELCAQYIKVLQTRNYSPHTVKSYSYDLRQFAGFCQLKDINLVQYINTQLLDEFVDALINGEGNTARTAARKVETVKGLLNFAMTRGLITLNAASNVTIRFDMHIVIAPAKEQLFKLLDEIDTSTAIGVRDKAMFHLLYDSGLRVSGALGLDLYDPSNPPDYCVLPNGVVIYRAKGGQAKNTVIGDESMQYLENWLSIRRSYCPKVKDAKALFLGRSGFRLSRASISNRVKFYGKKAGLPDMHCHLFRHARAFDIYQKTHDLQLVKDFLGHASIATTGNIYGLKSGEVMRQQIRKQAPLVEARA